MKKKLLFVMPSLCSGGAEKSLVTLLTLLDYEKYDVDLLLFRREGLFVPCLPEQVNIIDGGKLFSIFDGNAVASIKRSLKRLDPRMALNRVKYAFALSSGNRKKTWDSYKKALPVLQKEYDVAIAYMEGYPIYYVAERASAKLKICYVHNDYSKLGLDADFDRPFFKEFKFLVSVSPECSQVLRETFPESAEKVRTIENITSPEVIKKMADGQAPEYADVSCAKILTVGRLRQQKGYDLALAAAEKLAADGVDYKWFSIGTGEMKEQIEKEIKEKNLEDKFILLGERANPYPYIAGCDVYVQPSRFEGKSIAIDEAKYLAKPIVATKFSTVSDQLTDGKTALLAEMNGADIAAKAEELLAENEKRKSLSDNLRKEKLGNEEELEKFYEMLGD